MHQRCKLCNSHSSETIRQFEQRVLCPLRVHVNFCLHLSKRRARVVDTALCAHCPLCRGLVHKAGEFTGLAVIRRFQIGRELHRAGFKELDDLKHVYRARRFP